ncbi:MAG: radical SAM protein [Nitrospirae bacterium]|nr:radical SAM protein [Nitrospirota bacterium]MCL5422137.1 radical SAM protein [Nitrospirota bacterium]
MMYSPFRHAGSLLQKNRIIHLTFFVTGRCNLRCPFCFYLSGQEKPAAAENELTLSEIERISRSMGALLWLAFSGGEVFLREDIVEISRIFYENNRPAIMLFPTNGMLPELIRDRTEEILRRCKKSVITVKLSLDGLNGAHDKLRGKKGSFEKTMTTYRLLEDLIERYPHFELGINTVFCSENQDMMDKIIDFVSGMKNVKTHTISMVRGDLLEKGFKKVDFQKYHAAIERLEKNLKNRTSRTYRFRGARIKAAQDILQRRLIHRTTLEKRRLIPCYAGKLNLVLTETGNVYPCELLTEAFGNIRDYDYDVGKITRSEKAREVIRSIMENRCYCTHECYFMTNILFNPRLYPLLAKEYVQL